MNCLSGILSKSELGGLEDFMRKWKYFWYQCHLLLFSRSVTSWLSVIPWTAVCKASLSFTISWNLLKLTSIESMMPSNHSILCRWSPSPPAFNLFPTSGSFLMSQLFASGGQSIGASASASVLPMNIQDWFLLGLTGLVSLLSNELSRVFSNSTVQKHQFFHTQLSYTPTLTSVHD